MNKCEFEKSLAYVYPDVASWCKNHEDALHYSAKSRAYIDWICPCCGFDIPHKSIANIVKDGLSCPKCSDKLPYSEKLMMHVLCYIRDNYLDWLQIETQYYPEWCVYKGKNNKKHKGRYDFALKRDEAVIKIIEMDGSFHYIDNEISGQTVEESQTIDYIKDSLAVKNVGVKPTRIDCQKSILSYIKPKIIESDLYAFFLQFGVDLKTDIDWQNCERRSLKTVVKQVCDLYNEGLHPFEIQDKTGLSHSGVYTYLRKGAAAGLCNYPDGRGLERKKQATRDRCSKAVICFNDNKTFKNAKEACEYYPNIAIYNQINAWAQRNKQCTILHPNGEPYDFMYVCDYEEKGYVPIPIIDNTPEHYKKPVVCATTQKRFDNIPKAAEYYKIDKQQIWYNCIGKCHSVGEQDGDRLIWVFEEDYNPKKEYRYTGFDGRKGIKKKSRKPVVCVNTGEVYECALDAQEKTGFSNSNINKCVNGKAEYAGIIQETREPLVWKWATDYNKNDPVILPKINKRQKRIIILDNMKIFNSIEDFVRYVHIRLDNKLVKNIINQGYGEVKGYKAMTLDYYFSQHPEIRNQIQFYREHVYLTNQAKDNQQIK